MIFGNNYLKVVHTFSCCIAAKFMKEYSIKHCQQKNRAKYRYTLIEQPLTIRNDIAVTAQLEYFDIHACYYACKRLQLQAQETIYLLILCATVLEQPQVLFTEMGSHCQEQFYSAAIFCCNLKRFLLSCEFRIYLATARTIITTYKTIYNNYIILREIQQCLEHANYIIMHIVFRLVNKYNVIECVLFNL